MKASSVPMVPQVGEEFLDTPISLSIHILSPVHRNQPQSPACNFCRRFRV